jgi:hypothetical protein
MNESLSTPASCDTGLSLQSGAASLNPAIARCRAAYEIAVQREKKRNRSNHEAASAGGEAFRNAMPPLSGYENIRDFIACTAYGMMFGAVGSMDGTHFLYAAQVAISALRTQPKTRETSAAPKSRKDET